MVKTRTLGHYDIKYTRPRAHVLTTKYFSLKHEAFLGTCLLLCFILLHKSSHKLKHCAYINKDRHFQRQHVLIAPALYRAIQGDTNNAPIQFEASVVLLCSIPLCYVVYLTVL